MDNTRRQLIKYLLGAVGGAPLLIPPTAPLRLDADNIPWDPSAPGSWNPNAYSSVSMEFLGSDELPLLTLDVDNNLTVLHRFAVQVGSDIIPAAFIKSATPPTTPYIALSRSGEYTGAILYLVLDYDPQTEPSPSPFSTAKWWIEADQGDLLQAPGGAAIVSDGDPAGLTPHHYNGGDFRQTSSANKPTWKENIFNSIYPALRFDGGDYLIDATDLPGITDTEGTMIIVAQTAGNQNTFVGSADESQNGKFLAWETSSDNKIDMAQREEGSDNEYKGATVLGSSVRLLVIESDDSAWTMRVDGSDESLTNVKGSNNGGWFGDTTSRDNVTIGTMIRNLGAGRYLTGDLGGVGYWSPKLSSGDLATIESSLATKYGITLP